MQVHVHRLKAGEGAAAAGAGQGGWERTSGRRRTDGRTIFFLGSSGASRRKKGGEGRGKCVRATAGRNGRAGQRIQEGDRTRARPEPRAGGMDVAFHVVDDEILVRIGSVVSQLVGGERPSRRGSEETIRKYRAGKMTFTLE